ncbi:nuclear transport factor 2 family protein [Streptomyces sp. SID11385]|uniref:nuclear transport factor 2 family protein n=1 Tax=Streptomyces sp. SID11385 TaxID=2706031 RepID=UPI0013CAFDFC|nr:nuclear transport factor 2 family protein [Streptomyces sp. SID11385]
MNASADILAVSQLIARYAELVDAGDFAGVGALFTGDSVFRGSGRPAVGGAGVEAMLNATVIRYEDGTPRTQHVTTTSAVEVDEDGRGARARSAVTVFQALPDFPLQAVAAGRYEDRLVRRGGRWLFAERRVRVHLVGDVSHHLRG